MQVKGYLPKDTELKVVEVPLEQLTEGETISPSLLEFPAIFMELQAIKFLRQKGYPQELLDALYIERNTRRDIYGKRTTVPCPVPTDRARKKDSFLHRFFLSRQRRGAPLSHRQARHGMAPRLRERHR